MLGKLLKYEFKSTARIFIPAYIALLGVTLIYKLTFLFENSVDIMIIPQMLMTFLYFVTVVMMFVLTYIISCTRFYSNLLGNEGYLMNTLPVKPGTHILSKLITSLVWLIASVVASLTSVFILALSRDLFDFLGDFFADIKDIIAFISESPTAVATVIICCVFAVVWVIAGFMMFFASMSAGQLIRGHRIIGAVVAYIIFNTAGQIFSTIVLVILAQTNMWTAIEETNVSVITDSIANPFMIMFSVYTVMGIAFIAVYYLITNHMLKRKLNLE